VQELAKESVEMLDQVMLELVKEIIGGVKSEKTVKIS
jgi:hypothetical protein